MLFIRNMFCKLKTVCFYLKNMPDCWQFTVHSRLSFYWSDWRTKEEAIEKNPGKKKKQMANMTWNVLIITISKNVQQHAGNDRLGFVCEEDFADKKKPVQWEEAIKKLRGEFANNLVIHACFQYSIWFTRVFQRYMMHVPLDVNAISPSSPQECKCYKQRNTNKTGTGNASKHEPTWKFDLTTFRNNYGGFFDPRPFTLDPRVVTLDPRPKGKLRTLDQKANS